MNPKVDFYFNKAKKWRDEMEQLRTIILDCGLTEELKWGVPCYTYNKTNVVLIHAFKDYCAVLFHKGVLLIRFTRLIDIIDLKDIIKKYILEAIEVEKSGIKVPLKKTSEFKMPVEFKHRLEKNSKLKKSFEALTPGRQRAYLLYFDGAKQSKTREDRIEKYITQILDGKGLND